MLALTGLLLCASPSTMASARCDLQDADQHARFAIAETSAPVDKGATPQEQQQEQDEDDQDAEQEKVSWYTWLTEKHKTPNFHFIDLLELIGG